MSTQGASACLLSRVARAALKEYGSRDFYVAQSPAEVVMTGAHLALLQRPEKEWLDHPESVARLLEISRLVDCIQNDPASINTPERGLGFVSDVFPRLLDNVKFLPASLSAEARQDYEQALALLYHDPPLVKTPGYQEFCLARADLEKKDVAIAELRANAGKTSTEQAPAQAEELARLTQLQAERRQAFEALDRLHAFSKAEGIVDAAERSMDEVPASVQRALANLAFVTNPITNQSHVACALFPAHLAEDSWARLRLTRTDIEAAAAGAGSADSGNEGEVLDDSLIESIELEVQTLVCERPWLWQALFQNPRWSWQVPSLPVAKGGELKQDDGLIPAYIHALVFARNLSVRGVPAPAAPQMALRALPLTSPGAVTRRPPTLLMRALAKPAAADSTSMAASFSAAEALPVPAATPSNRATTMSAAVVTLPFVTKASPAVATAAPIRISDFGGIRIRDHRTKVTEPSTPVASCKVLVRLVETRNGAEHPFSGGANVTLRGTNFSRVEVMRAVSEATFSVPAGNIDISVASDAAESIAPASARLAVTPGATASLTFNVRRAPLLHNAEVQLLAVVCRRVRPCPA